MSGRFVSGTPTTFLALDSRIHPNEAVVEVVLAPQGHVIAVLSQLRVQFWSALQTMTQLAMLSLPSCSAAPGGDAAHRIVWNPVGRSLVVATLDRRLIFVEADIVLENNEVVRSQQDCLEFADVPSRVCVGFEVQLESGLITSLAASLQSLLVCTSGGLILGVGWNRGRVLFTWSSSYLLQRCVSERFGSSNSTGGNTAAGGSSGCDASGFGSTTGAAAASTVKGVGGVAITSALTSVAVSAGSIVYFTYSIKHRTCVFVLADGSVGLLRVNFNQTSGQSSPHDSPTGNAAVVGDDRDGRGRCYSGVGASLAALSATYGVLAVSGSGSSLRFLSVDLASLTLEPRDGKDGRGRGSASGVVDATLGSASPWCDDVKQLGGVRHMCWTSDDSALVVCFRKRGVAVFHHSGSCLMASFGRYEGAARRSMPLLQRGCVSAAWDAEGYRLVCVGHDAQKLAVIPFRRVAAHADASAAGGFGGTLVLLGAESISMLQSEDDGREEGRTWEAVDYPQDYVRDNFPIRFGGVSSDGQFIAVGGTYGAAIFSRRLRRWRLFLVKRQERLITCVADPCWVSDLLVALPVRSHLTKVFELQFYPRFHLNETSLVSKVDLPRRPVLVRSAPLWTAQHSGYALAVLDSGNVVTLYRTDVLADSVTAPHAVGLNIVATQSLLLPEVFGMPTQLLLAPLPRNAGNQPPLSRRGRGADGGGSGSGGGRRRRSLAAGQVWPRVLFVARSGQLVAVDLVTESSQRSATSSLKECSETTGAAFSSTANRLTPYGGHFTILSAAHERVMFAWLDLHAQVLFPSGTVVVCHDSDGMVLRVLEEDVCTAEQSSISGSTQRSESSSTPPPYRVWLSRIAEVDPDTVPIGILPLDGVVVFATEGTEPQPFAALPSRFRAATKLVLYAHRLLYPVMRELSSRNSAFSGTDFRVHGDGASVAMHDGLVSSHLHNPLPIAGGGSGPASSHLDPTTSEMATRETAVLDLPSCVEVDDDGIAWNTTLLQRLREHGSFVGIMDYLLHLILHEDSVFSLLLTSQLPAIPRAGCDATGTLLTKAEDAAACRVNSVHAVALPPAADASSKRQKVSLLHATLSLLKVFSEYHTVVVGLIRKVDMSKWKLMFDVVGAPMDLFEDCMSTGNLVEAAHMMRVIMMDPSAVHMVKAQRFVPLSVGGGAAGGAAPSAVSAGSGGAFVASALSNTPASQSSSSSSAAAGSLHLPLGTDTGMLPTGSSSASASQSVTTLGAAPQGAATIVQLSQLEAASRCALRLLPIALDSLDLVLVAELLRFLSMLLVELTNGECLSKSAGSEAAHHGQHVTPGGSPNHAAAGVTAGMGLRGALSLDRLRQIWNATTALRMRGASPQRSGTLPAVAGPAVVAAELGADDLATAKTVSRSAIRLALCEAWGSLEFRFISPHQDDNAACQALLRRFPEVRSDLQRAVVQDMLLPVRMLLLFRLVRALCLDPVVLLGTVPWNLVALQWIAEAESTQLNRDTEDRLKNFLEAAIRRELPPARLLRYHAEAGLKGPFRIVSDALMVLADAVDAALLSKHAWTTSATTGGVMTAFSETLRRIATTEL